MEFKSKRKPLLEFRQKQKYRAHRANMVKINLQDKFSKFSEHWTPKVIAEMNDYQFKLVKIEGEFVWHNHSDTDEVFIVVEGKMMIEFEHETIELNQGEMYVVPRGVQHKPYAEQECKVMLVEPKGVVNTGEASGDLTAQNDVWIQYISNRLPKINHSIDSKYRTYY